MAHHRTQGRDAGQNAEQVRLDETHTVNDFLLSTGKLTPDAAMARRELNLRLCKATLASVRLTLYERRVFGKWQKWLYRSPRAHLSDVCHVWLTDRAVELGLHTHQPWPEAPRKTLDFGPIPVPPLRRVRVEVGEGDDC